jgi:hypothetical protein
MPSQRRHWVRSRHPAHHSSDDQQVRRDPPSTQRPQLSQLHGSTIEYRTPFKQRIRTAAIILVISVATFLASLDLFVVNLALHHHPHRPGHLHSCSAGGDQSGQARPGNNHVSVHGSSRYLTKVNHLWLRRSLHGLGREGDVDTAHGQRAIGVVTVTDIRDTKFDFEHCCRKGHAIVSTPVVFLQQSSHFE